MSSRAAFQGNLDRVRELTNRNMVKFNKYEHWSSAPGKEEPPAMIQTGGQLSRKRPGDLCSQQAADEPAMCPES